MIIWEWDRADTKKKLLSLFHYFGWLAFFFSGRGWRIMLLFFSFLATAMAYNSRLLEKETDKKMGLPCDCV